MRRAAIAAVVALWALGTGRAQAGELTHVLASGESLGGVASQYYGSSWKSVYIAARNGIVNERDIAAGSRLVIPASFTYRVRRGDAVGEIAKRYLGDAARYKVLMAENGIKDATDLDVGAELLLPFHLRHVVEPGDSWSRIAQRYYRTTRRAGLVRDYNPSLESLNPGDKVTVPIFDRATLDAASRRAPPRPTAPAPQVSAKSVELTRPGPAKTTTPPNVRAAIAKAVEDYKRGEYEDGCAVLESTLAQSGLAASERATVVSYLGFCAVAAGDRQAALDYFRKWREIDPKAQLDPVNTSPKILAIFQEVLEVEEALASEEH